MDPARPLFREEALREQASPDQLDALVGVTNPLTWLALFTLLCLVAGVVAWAFLGRIPVLVSGRGILLDRSGLWVIPAPGAGEVAELAPHEGDYVKRGEIVARIMPLEGYPNASMIDVLSPYEGRVAHLSSRAGLTVAPGETLLQIARSRESLDAILYLPIDDGKKVRPGMAVRVTPSNVNIQRDGYVFGTIAEVAHYPSSAAEMRQTLGTEDLVRVFLQGASLYQSAPLRVDVDLQSDPGTPSGLHWSTLSGPPFELSSGTVCTAEITVSSERPLDFVLPYLERKLTSAPE